MPWGQLFSALIVIYIGDRLTNQKFKDNVDNRRFGKKKKIITVFEEGDDNKKVLKVRIFINKHGLRIFFVPVPDFPGRADIHCGHLLPGPGQENLQALDASRRIFRQRRLRFRLLVGFRQTIMNYAPNSLVAPVVRFTQEAADAPGWAFVALSVGGAWAWVRM